MCSSHVCSLLQDHPLAFSLGLKGGSSRQGWSDHPLVVQIVVRTAASTDFSLSHARGILPPHCRQLCWKMAGQDEQSLVMEDDDPRVEMRDEDFEEDARDDVAPSADFLDAEPGRTAEVVRAGDSTRDYSQASKDQTFASLSGTGGMNRNAEHVAEPLSIPQSLTDVPMEESDEDTWARILEDFNRLGMDPYKIDFPDKASHDDFYDNHRDLPIFWGIQLHRNTRVEDVSYRRRQAVILTHTDKLSRHSPQIQAWGLKMTQTINSAFDCMTERIEWIKQGVSRPQQVFTHWLYQELPEDFQIWLMENLDTTILISQTSDGFAHNMAKHFSCGPGLEAARSFFDKLARDFQQHDLLDILGSLFVEGKEAIRGQTLTIVMQFVPRFFDSWLQKQLVWCREKGWFFTLNLIFFCDAWPCTWQGVLKFYDNYFLDRDAARIFKLADLLFSPPVNVVISTGSSQMRLLKRCLGVTLTTDSRPIQRDFAISQHREVIWRPSLLPRFNAFKRLWIDVAATERLHALQVASQVGSRYNALGAPRILRSFGDAGFLKRRAAVLTFPASFPQLDEDFMKFVGAQLVEGEVLAAVGWETLYEVPEHTFILKSGNLHWLKAIHTFPSVAQAVVVSKQKVIVSLSKDSLIKDLVADVTLYNSTRDSNLIDEVRNHHTGPEYMRPRHMAVRPEMQRPPSLPAWTSADLVLVFNGCPETLVEEFTTSLCETGVATLRSKGWTGGGITPYFQRKNGVAANRVLIIPDSEQLGRAFFNLYQDCLWESHIPGQEIGVRLFNEKFQQERDDNLSLRLFSRKEALTPPLSAILTSGMAFPDFALAMSARRGPAMLPDRLEVAESQRALPPTQPLQHHGQQQWGGGSASGAPGGAGA